MATTTLPGASGALRATTRRRGFHLPASLVVLVAAGLVTAMVLTRSGTGDGITGALAPPFSLDDVRSPGTPVALAGGRPTVVNFFAAWCVPCRQELPLLERASQRSAGTVSFVGVDVNDSRTAATDLLDRAGVTYPTGYDPDRSVAGRYRLQGMPTTVFVDADGRVTGMARGRLTAAELDRRLAEFSSRAEVGTP